MNPFPMNPFPDQPLVELLGIPIYQPLHNDQYAPRVYRATYGQLCATTQVTDGQDVLVTANIHHPNVLQRWGVTDFDPNNQEDVTRRFLFDCIHCNFDELDVDLGRTEFQPGPVIVDVASQTLFGLDGMRFQGLAHGNLNAGNIGIQLLPHRHDGCNGRNNWDFDVARYSDEGPKLVVKLKGFNYTPGNPESYLEDLMGFGHVLMPHFLDNQNQFKCEEAEDLIHRIFNDWPQTSNLCTADQYNRLSIRLRHDFAGVNAYIDQFGVSHPQYVGQAASILEHPFFWDEKKCLAFFHLLGEFLDRRYHRRYTGSNYTAWGNVPSIFLGFLDHLKRLEVSGWYDDLPEFVRERCANSTRFRDGDEDTVIGLIKCIRNAIIHWENFTDDERDMVGHSNCYEFFRDQYPMLLVHAYTCVQLHYGALSMGDNNQAFDDNFRPFVSSGFRGL